MELTIEEKVRLLAGKNAWETEDLGGKVPSVRLSDGPVGVRKPGSDGKDLPAVAYPSSEVLSQTWNPDLAYLTGECLADDCIEADVDVLLAPGVNIKRSPVCGRNFEYFSEDPYLAGVFGREYIRGIQDHHVGATLKHFVANNNEVGRMWADSDVDERTMREIYLRPFEIALDAKPWAVMSSYNPVGGIHMSRNETYLRILRDELGHGDGLVMSDWDAVHDHPASVRAGTDLEMPYHEGHKQDLLTAVREGEVTERALNQCAERVLMFAEKNRAERERRAVTRSVQERSDAALRVAEEGIVLLKNNGVLPIRNGQSVSVAAHHFARQNYYAGNGSSRVVLRTPSPSLQSTLSAVLPDSRVSAADVWGVGYPETFEQADTANVSLVVCGAYAGEANDRRTLRLHDLDDEEFLIRETARRNPNTVVILYGCGVVDMSDWVDEVAAVLYVGYPGERGNEAIANILSGVVNPSGKLSETFGKTQADYPSEHARRDAFHYHYDEGMQVGYRYFDKHPEAVRFPFGFGLSYTEFRWGDPYDTTRDGVPSVAIPITNVGDRDGMETVGVYVASDGTVTEPVKQLKGFGKVFVRAGDTGVLTIPLDRRAFDRYLPENHRWEGREGEVRLLFAASAQDVRATLTVTV